jgi:hypothetical protein
VYDIQDYTMNGFELDVRVRMERSSRAMAIPKSGAARRFVRVSPRIATKRQQDIRRNQEQREHVMENRLYEGAETSVESAWNAESHASFGAKLNRMFELAVVGMLGGAGLGSLAGANGTVVGLIIGGVFCVWNEGMAGFGRHR